MLIFGFVGIAGRGIMAGYLRGLVKGAEEMGRTRRKELVKMRKRYEDIASLDVQINDFDSFVDKYIDRLRIGGITVHAWNAFTKNMGVLVAGTGIFSALHAYYVAGDSGEALGLAACAAGVCLAMLVFWNQWDVAWHLKSLRDSVKNYLSNSLSNRLQKLGRAAAASQCMDFQEGAAKLKKSGKRHAKEECDALLDMVMQTALADG